MPFTELCIYQVKPQKIAEFEALLPKIQALMEQQMRNHIDRDQIKEGLPPKKLTRIVKSMKYMLYWEFDTKESYSAAQKNLYESYWKAIEKCLVAPHDKYLGEGLFSWDPHSESRQKAE